jgi:hypothetical protein
MSLSVSEMQAYYLPFSGLTTGMPSTNAGTDTYPYLLLSQEQ